MMMNNANPRESFTIQLKNLAGKVLVMGSMVDHSVRDSVYAFETGNLMNAELIIQNDLNINLLRFQLENECISLIATQQPMGRDVRFLTATLEIITELERIGDYAKGISKITLLEPDRAVSMLVMGEFTAMMENGLCMLENALTAYINTDCDSAGLIPESDDLVDSYYNSINERLIKIATLDPSRIRTANYLMWAAHDLERLADRVTNICERIVYVSTGEMHEINSDIFLR
jgi:phosphate transport system protein